MPNFNLYDVFWRIADSAGSNWMLLGEKIEGISHEDAQRIALDKLDGSGTVPISLRSYEVDSFQMNTYRRVTRWEAE